MLYPEQWNFTALAIYAGNMGRTIVPGGIALTVHVTSDTVDETKDIVIRETDWDAAKCNNEAGNMLKLIGGEMLDVVVYGNAASCRVIN